MKMQIDDNKQVLLWKVSRPTEFPKDYQSRFHTHIYCQRGNIDFIFNEQKFCCKTGEFIFWLAGNNVSEIAFSANFSGTILFVEKDFLMDNLPNLNLGIDAVVHHRINPILHPDDKKDKEKILKNFQSLYDKSCETSHTFYKEIMKLEMQLFVLDMWHIFLEQFARHRRSLQNGTLYERFTQLLEEYCMKEREVRFYAGELNITPKYLNQICKMNTGVPASQWIQRYAKERIMVLLRSKNLNISEIADEMGFSSYSFFTRYVKRLLGVTPSEYRERLNT
ncbi:helix-turn-helix domain-containing protein [Sphingobacterium sp.]|uniref:helix-turn-helix domain-containing protein n=1 Tax=Sphingobacterium sp. TaxID=341027 RepID=UPI00289A5E50|nr:helix-turn-helix domain-containing protein [Sphingobacterium sp.]